MNLEEKTDSYKIIVTSAQLKAFEKYLRSERKRQETINSYLRRARQFLVLINKDPCEITKADILSWKDFCTKYNSNSLTPMYSAIKKYITYLADKEIIDDSLEIIARRKLRAPKQQYDEDNIERLVLKPEDYKRVFQLSKKKNYMHYALFKTMFWSQARRCEVIGLKISDIDFPNKKVTFSEETAKGGKKATVNLAQECLDILREYIENIRDKPRKDSYQEILFLRNGYPISRTKIWEIHNEYRAQLDIELHTHMWRHTGITEYAKVEKDVKKVQRQARHDDVNITMRYINYAQGDYDKSYHEKFARQKPQEPTPSKPESPKPKPENTYIAKSDQEDYRDTLIQELKAKIENLEKKLEHPYVGYQ
jgi:integrase/recombinase XerC